MENEYRAQVALLLRIIPFVAQESVFALKGGTAINLFVQDMPRLSVDIDLTYLPFDVRNIALQNISAALKRIKNAAETAFSDIEIITITQKENNDATLIINSDDNAQIKIEVNTIMRGHIFEPKLMSYAKKVSNEFETFAQIQVVSKGGCIFDSDGNESKQMDIYIASDSSLRFSYFDNEHGQNKSIQTIEGCLAAISVKSTLNKTELNEALENLASMPFMPEYMLGNVSHFISGRENYLNFPFKVVFAFDGANVKSILKNINEFYSENQYDDRQKADLIVVNNSFCIERAPKGGAKTRNGSHISQGTYHPMYDNDTKKFGALPLLRLLMLIQNHCSWTPHVILKYQKYFNAMNFYG